MRPLNVAVCDHIPLPVAAFWPHSAETARYLCPSEFLWAMVRSECRCLVCTTIERGDTPQKCSRRLGCRRASKQFWPSASSFWQLPVHNSSKKKLLSSKIRSCLSRYPRSTKLLSGRELPAPSPRQARRSHENAGKWHKSITSKFNDTDGLGRVLDARVKEGYPFINRIVQDWRIKCQYHSRHSGQAQRLPFFLPVAHSNSRLSRRWLHHNLFITSLVRLSAAKAVPLMTRTMNSILASRKNVRMVRRLPGQTTPAGRIATLMTRITQVERRSEQGRGRLPTSLNRATRHVKIPNRDHCAFLCRSRHGGAFSC